MKYSSQAKREFMNTLSLYREALESRDSRAIVATSIRVHVASGQVPKAMRRYIGQVWREVTESRRQATQTG